MNQDYRYITNYEIQYLESNNNNYIYLNFIPHRVSKINNNRISVNLFLFDGLSRMAFNHQFKETQKFLLLLSKDYYIFDMLRYHSIGLNSRPNYVPLFYGMKFSNKIFKVYYNLYFQNKSLFNYFHIETIPVRIDKRIINYIKSIEEEKKM